MTVEYGGSKTTQAERPSTPHGTGKKPHFQVRARYGNQCYSLGSLPGASFVTFDSFDINAPESTPSHERLAIAAASGLTKFGTAFSVVSSSATSKRVPRASARDGGLSTPQYLRAVR